MDSKKVKKWEKTRKLGKINYALLYSISSGIVFVILFWFVAYFLNKINFATLGPPDVLTSSVMLVVWVLINTPLALFAWKKNEKEFLEINQKYEQNRSRI